MNKDLQTIRDACVAANSEIMELKFGCKIYKPNYWKNAKDENRYGTIVGEFESSGTNGVFINWQESGGYSSTIPLYDFSEKHPEGLKILGRPIQLADVLLAIGKKEKGRLYSRADGNKIVFFKWHAFVGAECHSVKPTFIEWDLTHPLSGQSPECLEFIANLLKN